MKKIIFAVLAIICSLTAIGQQEQRPQYFDDYLFPRYMASGCYDTTTISLGYTNCVNQDGIALAQPFFIDSAISIKGIGAFVFLFQPDLMNLQQPYYLQIRDASLNNILAQIRYDTLISKRYGFGISYLPEKYYIEELFDSTIFISDTLFYITMTFPSVHKASVLHARMYDSDCNNGDFPVLVQVKDSSNWIPFIEVYGEYVIDTTTNEYVLDTMNVPYELLVFPILGTVASSGGLNQVRADKDISIYPNPARDEINIISSFKINNIVVYNTLGQKVIEETINGNTTQLDVSKFAKGNYIAKIYTDNGVATKKFIVE